MSARFADRADAGRRLASGLASYRNANPLILAIPRGGVPIGRIVADALDGELDLVLVRKLGAPFNPEVAIGAVDEAGTIRLEPEAREIGANEAFVEQEAARELALIRERRKRYSPHRAPIDPRGRTVIVVDDGLATGATMRSALAAIRAAHPARLVCAVPVAAPDSLDEVAELCDETFCLDAPEDFHAVGQFYVDFQPVGDAVVESLLAHKDTGARGASREVEIRVGLETIRGDLDVPVDTRGLVIFAHGSGSGRLSPRNRFVARALNEARIATLLCDLLTVEEDRVRAHRFDVRLLAARLDALIDWAAREEELRGLATGLFGASTGAAAALVTAARRPSLAAIVSRGGRPDLAGPDALERVTAPTLLVVGGHDPDVLALNRAAMSRMRGEARLVIVPGATHLFEEAGALECVAALAARWFEAHFPELRSTSMPGRTRGVG